MKSGGAAASFEQRALLVGVTDSEAKARTEHPLAELRRLVATAGATVVAEITQRRDRPDRRFFVGKGKAQEAADLAEAEDVDLVIFDNDLTPAQERNLAGLVQRPVVDRSRLILDIFATHARSRQSKLQIELAQLVYLRSRLTGMWSHLTRERLEGSIGSRGPGEKQLEVDRRLVAKRIQRLKKALCVVERQQVTRSAARDPYFKVSLVGYTNAGKSTLLRQLTGTDTLVADKLFATLDTQTRAWELPDRQRVFLSDTVGFIRDLPHHLVASFHSTLAEVVRADLLLHVVDASGPDATHQMRVVEKVLGEIGAGGARSLVILNKVDQISDRMVLSGLESASPGAVALSAATGRGVDRLEERVASIVRTSLVSLELTVPAGAGKVIALIAERAQVIEERYEGDTVHYRILVASRDAALIRGWLKRGVRGY